MSLTWLDWLLMLVYFASVVGVGVATSHFYSIGAIPAMVFLGVFMMPFYYGSRARSVPEYLRLRFDEKPRGFNAISFALFRWDDAPRTLTVRLPGAATVTDHSTAESLGRREGVLSIEMAPRSARLLKVVS